MPAEASTDVYPDIAFEAPNDSFDVTPVESASILDKTGAVAVVPVPAPKLTSFHQPALSKMRQLQLSCKYTRYLQFPEHRSLHYLSR